MTYVSSFLKKQDFAASPLEEAESNNLTAKLGYQELKPIGKYCHSKFSLVYILVILVFYHCRASPNHFTLMTSTKQNFMID